MKGNDMNNSITSRLKVLEEQAPAPLVLLVQDADGNKFECSVAEFEAHGDMMEGVTSSGEKIRRRRWEFIKILRGVNLDEARRVLACMCPDSAI